MNANNRFLFKISAALVLVVFAGAASAVANLDAHGQSKVSNAMAKKWSQTGAVESGYKAQQDKSLVNIGSKKGGDCVVNVGTVEAPQKGQKAQKAPKDIIVTTKEVINVCK
jgi:hypothetical protein